MMIRCRNLLKYIFLPLVWGVYRLVKNKGKYYGIEGDFSSWEDAEKFFRDNG